MAFHFGLIDSFDIKTIFVILRLVNMRNCKNSATFDLKTFILLNQKRKDFNIR